MDPNIDVDKVSWVLFLVIIGTSTSVGYLLPKPPL